MKDMLKNNKGITLMALTITIVVMIILAFVIYYVLSSGIMDKAKYSADETIKSQEREYIKLAYQEAELRFQEYGEEISVDTFKKQLELYENSIEVKEFTQEKLDGYEVVVDRNDSTGYAQVEFIKTGNLYIVALANIDNTVPRYTVRYDANEGTGAPAEQTKVKGKILIISNDKPTRAGYSFEGWATTSTSITPEYASGATYTTDSDVTLYAVWGVRKYNIKYNLNEGVETQNPTKYSSSTPTFTLNIPTKEGFIFEGWTGTGLSKKTLQVTIEKGSSGDKEYTANWGLPNYVIDEKEYASTLNLALERANDGSVIRALQDTIETEDVTINKSVTLDLSGFTVSENKTIVVSEEGSLTVKDTGNEGEYTGKIVNATGVAIENRGELILGEDNGVISMTPAIEGKTIGITTQTGTLCFYDGQVTAKTAIDRENIITPSTYYAMAVTNGDTETVTLQTLGSAVARIGYRYYSTLNEAEEAASSGRTYDANENAVIGPVTTCANYYFVQNEDGTLTNWVDNKTYSIARSYIKIDLSKLSDKETHSLILNITSKASGNSSAVYAAITNTSVVPDMSSSAGRFVWQGGIFTNYDFKTQLKGGDIYYLHIGTRYYNHEKVIINSLKLDDNNIDLSQTESSNIPYNTTHYVPAEEQTKITLVTDVTVSGEAWKIDDIRNIKLDLNGYTLSASGSINTIINSGKLEIIDRSIDKTGRISNSIENAIVNNTQSKLIINNITSASTAAGANNDKYRYWIESRRGTLNVSDCTYSISHNYNGFIQADKGTATIDNNTITSTTTGYCTKAIEGLILSTLNTSNNIITLNTNSNTTYGIVYKGEKTLTSQNDTITGKNYCYGIYNEYKGIVNLKDSNIKVGQGYTNLETPSIYNAGIGKIIIDGGTTETIMSSNTYYNDAIINNGTGTIEIKNHEIKNAIYAVKNNNASGVILIDNANISKCRYGIYNKGNIDIKNSTINITDNTYDSLYGIYNYENGNSNIENTDINITYSGSGSITACGIYNKDSSNSTVKKGNISAIIAGKYGYSYGIYNNGTGKVVIGEKGNSLNTESPTIEGTVNGIYNYGNGTIEFYDGKIIAPTTALNGTLYEIEDNTQVNSQIVEQKQNLTLVSIANAVKIEETGEYYNTIQDAIKACSTINQNTITLLKDLYVTGEDITIESNKNIVIDFKDYDIYLGNKIINNGKLKLKDSTGTGRMITSAAEVITNNIGATLEVETIKYILKSSGTSTIKVIGIYNKGELILTSGAIEAQNMNVKAIENIGTMKINGGTVETKGTNAFAIVCEETGTITMTGGEIKGTGTGTTYAIWSSSTGKIEVTGGKISQTNNIGYAIFNVGTGPVIMTGGEIYLKLSNSMGYGIYNESTAEISITGVNIDMLASSNYGTSACAIYNKVNGKVTIKDSTINTDVYGVYNNTTGEIYIENTDVTSSKSYYLIKNSEGGKITYKGGTVFAQHYAIHNTLGTIELEDIECSTSINSPWTISNDRGTLKIKSGNITNICNTQYDGYGVGIYNQNAGTLIIGEKDGEATKTSPSISGMQHGIYQNGTGGKIYFYDGIIRGKTDSIYGEIEEIEEGYNIIKEQNTEDNYYETYLAKVVIAQIDDNQYYDLQTAINSIPENNETAKTIKIIKDNTIMSELTTGNRKIVLDLNGKSLNISMTLENTGNLEIIDSSEEKTGKLVSSSVGESASNKSRGIYNAGTLTLTSGTIESQGRNIELIFNEGTLTLNSGKIEVKENYSAGIVNIGKLTMTGGEIKGTGRYYYTWGIYNTEKGEVLITGGKISQEASNSSGIANVREAKLTMTGGEINIKPFSISAVNGIYNESTKDMSITGVVFNNQNTYTYAQSKSIVINSVKAANILIKDSIINTHDYGIINTDAGEIIIENTDINGGSTGQRLIQNISNGKITYKNGILTGTETIVYNAGEGTVELENIECTSSGSSNIIYNSGSGTLHLKSGTVISTYSSIYTYEYDYVVNNSGLGNLIIGEKDGVVSTTSPKIESPNHAVYNISGNNNLATGKVYFYDGIIRGKIDSITGPIEETEEGYNIVKEQNSEDSYYETYLTKVAIAQVDDNQYYDLQTAINSISEGNEIPKTITILKNNTILSEITTGNRKIVLDLNGKEQNISKTLQNIGSLEVIDSSEEKAGKLITSNTGESKTIKAIGINNTGILTLTSGTISSQNIRIKVIENTGTVTINGGKIETRGYDSFAVVSKETGKVTMTGGEISGVVVGTRYGEQYGIWNSGTGETLITGGKITGTGSLRSGYGIYNAGTGKVTMTGGEISIGLMSNSYGACGGIYNGSTAEISITGVTFNIQSNYTSAQSNVYTAFNNAQGKITIKDSTITTHDYAIRNNGEGEINIENTDINGGTTGFGIENYAGGKITYKGGNINVYGRIVNNSGTGTVELENMTSNTLNNQYAIQNTGTLILKSGANISNAYNSTSGYGIYNSGTGTVIIGEKGGEINTITPSISAIGNGIYQYGTTGKIYFYDGIIKGKTATYNGTLTEIEPNYQISKATEEGYYCDTLIPVGGAVTVATIGDVNYNSLQDAILSCELGNEVIVLQRNIELDESSVTINEDKNIIINLNGKKIISTSEISAITNNGTLEIKDTNTGLYGTVENQNGVAIVNNGTLNIGNNDEIISLSTPRIIGTTIGIQNNGTIGYYDGIISGQTAVQGEIATIASGYETQKSTTNGIETLKLKSTEITISYTISGNTVSINGTKISKIVDPSNVETLADASGNISVTYTANSNGTYAFKITSTEGKVTVLNITI